MTVPFKEVRPLSIVGAPEVLAAELGGVDSFPLSRSIHLCQMRPRFLRKEMMARSISGQEDRESLF